MTYIAGSQICLNEDRSKIVPCDSPEAYVNLALPGAEVADEVAEKYGLVKLGVVSEGVSDPAPSPEPVEEEKEPQPIGGKAVVGPAQNKAKSMGGKK